MVPRSSRPSAPAVLLAALIPLAAGLSCDRSSARRDGAAPAVAARAPNEMGRVPILEYHIIGDSAGRWERERARFAHDLELLYERGYRPVTLSQLIDRRIDLPAGLSPVVITFDDASPSQFRYIERGDSLEIDSTSAVGIWLAFHRTHPDWENRAVFCLLPAAEAGRAFFGNRNIEGQKSAWRLRKVRFLADQGFELCDHTLWHAQLSEYSDEVVQEQIARGALAIDSAVPGYRVRVLALPLGRWPKNRALARTGAWRDPKSGREVRYAFDAVLRVAGGPSLSPHDPAFDPYFLPRVQVIDDDLERMLDQLDRSKTRYVSDGDTSRVSHRDGAPSPPDAAVPAVPRPAPRA